MRERREKDGERQRERGSVIESTEPVAKSESGITETKAETIGEKPAGKGRPHLGGVVHHQLWRDPVAPLDPLLDRILPSSAVIPLRPCSARPGVCGRVSLCSFGEGNHQSRAQSRFGIRTLASGYSAPGAWAPRS